MRRVVVAAVMFTAACASAPPQVMPAPPAAAPATTDPAERSRLEARVAFADARMLEGCYDCLLDARKAYEEAAANRELRRTVVARLFETHLLLALREKELALDSRASLDSARAIQPELAKELDAGTAIAIVEAIPPDVLGTSSADAAVFRRGHRPATGAVSEWRTWLQTSALSATTRRYIDLSLDCYFPSTDASADVTPPPDVPPGTPPLLAYRMAVCPIVPDVLAQVRSDVPAFVETSYFLGRFALRTLTERGPSRPLALFAEARARFPTSSSMAYLQGAVYQVIESYDAAIRSYDDAIAASPLLDSAWIGRVESLTLLARHDEAIDAATTLINADERLTEAYYWRARNWHATGNLAAARENIEIAKQRSNAGDVLTLAGIIEYDQRDLLPAERDLTAARAADADGQNCMARWYLGFVEEKRARPADAAEAFAAAGVCYGDDAALNEQERREVALNDELEADYKAGRLAKCDRTMAEDLSQQSASAYNAAVNYLRTGNKTKASEFADLAARDPQRVGKVEELRKIIKFMR